MTTAAVPNPEVLERHLHTKAAAVILRVLHITNDTECSTATALLERFAQSTDPAIDPFINLLAEAIESYEQKHHAIPNATPAEALAFYMQLHNLRQSDLPEIARQSHISEMLSGKRAIGLEIAKALAKRFDTSPMMFI